MQSSNSAHFETVKPLVKLLTYGGMAVFVALVISYWMAPSQAPIIGLLRHFSLVILMFMTGLLWGVAYFADLDGQSTKLNRHGLIWGGALLVIAATGNSLLEDKINVFLSAMLFLLVWQIEKKTEAYRVYPEWYWVLRTQASMTVAICHLLVWLTLA
jgi:hypothetical protein